VILSGQSRESSYDDTFSWRGQPASRLSGKNTLTRQGEEELLIGGQRIRTVRLTQAYTRTYSALNSGRVVNTWELWYAPDLHIFVKGRFTGNYGFYNGGPLPPPPDFEVTSVQEPGPQVTGR
jgi:hypothetical protein